MAAVLIVAGALLVSVAAGLACGAALGPAFGLAAGMGVAGVLALWFGIDASRDVLLERVEGEPDQLAPTLNLLESR
jgi:hypothetical protein